MRFRNLFLLLFIFLFGREVSAMHGGPNDGGYGSRGMPGYLYKTWKLFAATDVNLELSDRIDLGFNLQHRRNYRMLDPEANLIEGMIKYRILKNLHVHSAYRFGEYRRTILSYGYGYRVIPASKTFKYRVHRVMFAAYYVLKKKGFPITAQFRARIEMENHSGRWDGGEYNTDFARARVKLKYRAIEWIEPYVSFETFRRAVKYLPSEFSRFEIGSAIKLSETSDLKTFYRREVDGMYGLNNYHILGVEIQFKFQ